eukprot:COSAG02_NODE_3807_length_6202_cov_12.468458_5_plen_167_part_01
MNRRSRREGHELMQDSIGQIQTDLSSMRSKYKAAVTHASILDSVSPVFSPGDSPGDGVHREAVHGSTPKQLQQGSPQEDRRALLRSRSPIRSVMGKSHSAPNPTTTMSPTSTHRENDTVDFSSSDDDAGWVGDQMVSPRPRTSSDSHTSRRLDWTLPMTHGRSSPRS